MAVVAEKKSAAPKEPEGIVLTPAMAENYTMQGTTYHKGKGYRFTQKEGMKLLSERDAGRQVWQTWKPPVPKAVVANTVQDATGVNVPEATEDAHGKTIIKGTPVELGNDGEIADVLGAIESSEGDVTI